MQTFLNLDKELKALSASHSISLMIKPRILQSGDPLATVVLSSTHYLGGAHGAAQTYYNFDLEQKKLIKLDDIILPKQKAQLEAKAYEAFKIWVMESKLANDVAEYEQAWKFKLTDNFTCLNRDWRCNMPNMRLVLMWWVLPRLVIPYEQLNGILKPEYLPQTENAASEAEPATPAKAR